MRSTIVTTAFSSIVLVLTACGGSGSSGGSGAGLEGGGAGGAAGGSGGNGEGGTEQAGGSGATATGGSGATSGGTGGMATGGEAGSGGSGAGDTGGAGGTGDTGGAGGTGDTGGAGGATTETDGGVSTDGGSCPTGYTGATCSDCAVGYTEDAGECVEACSVVDCGVRGACAVDDLGRAACQCDEGYDGAACDACATGYRFVPVVIGDPILCELDTPATTNMVVWLDAEDASTFSLTATNDVISWNSRVAGGTFTTSDSSTRPRRPVPRAGGHAWVTFDGSDDRLHRTVTLNGSYSIFVVGRAGTSALDQMFLHGVGVSNVDRSLRLLARDAGQTLLLRHTMPAGNDEVSIAYDTTVRGILEGHRAGLALTLHDGTDTNTLLSVNPFDQDLDLWLGRRGDSTLGALDGEIGEVIIFAPAVDSNERQAVRDYLAAKWDL